MGIITIIAILAGIWHFRSREYFKWVGFSVLSWYVFEILFYDDSGIISSWLKEVSHNEALMLTVGILAVIGAWVSVFYMLSVAVTLGNAAIHEKTKMLAEGNAARKSLIARKLLETFCFALLSVGWFYIIILKS